VSSSDKLLRCRSCGISYLVVTRAEPEGALKQPAAQSGICPGCAALEKLAALGKGVIKWFDPRRGYGFVKLDHGPQVFFHRSRFDCESRLSIRRGARVEVEIEDTGRGQRARRISLVSDPEKR